MAIQDTLPKSRLTLRYRTEIHGAPEDIELPLRILIAGDFSGKGTPKKPFESRKVANFDGKNLNTILDKMKIKVPVTDSDGTAHTIAINTVDSFRPDHIINSINSMGERVNAKNMLNALLSSINNSNKFRSAIRQLVADPAAVTALKELMAPSYQKDATLPANLNTDANAA